MQSVLTISSHIPPDDPILDVADSALTNWKLHLPLSKDDVIDEDGRVDKMLFQAKMLTNVYARS